MLVANRRANPEYYDTLQTLYYYKMIDNVIQYNLVQYHILAVFCIQQSLVFRNANWHVIAQAIEAKLLNLLNYL